MQGVHFKKVLIAVVCRVSHFECQVVAIFIMSSVLQWLCVWLQSLWVQVQSSSKSSFMAKLLWNELEVQELQA